MWACNASTLIRWGNFWFKAEQRAVLKNFLSLKDVFASPWQEFSETLRLIVAYYMVMDVPFLPPLSPTWRCDLKKWKNKKQTKKKLIGAVFFESHGQNVSAVNLKVFALQPASSYGNSCNKWLADVASSLFSINTWLRPAARRAPNPPSLRCHKCSPKNKRARVKNALCYRLPRLLSLFFSLSFLLSSDFFFFFWHESTLRIVPSPPLLCFFRFVSRWVVFMLCDD